MSRPVLSIANLALERGRSDQTFRIEVPELELLPGQVVAVVGPSGCGKSTLLETIGLLLQAHRVERFHIDDIDIRASMSLDQATREQLWARIRQHGLGFVPQTGGLLPYLNVWQNICLPVRMSRSVTVDPLVQKLIQRLNLKSLLNRMPRELSIGERQRVSFVRSLARRPTLLLADEPTAALDPTLAQELFSLIVEITTQEGIATLIVTHEWDLVDRFGLQRLTGQQEGAGKVVFHA